MKQKLLKSMLLLCALVVGSGTMWGEDTFVKVTSASDLVADAEYLLVSGTVAYSGVSSNIGQKVTVTFTEDIITNPSTAHILRLGGSTNAWTFYDLTDSKYLAYTSTATSKSNYLYQVASSDADGATWTLTASSTAVKMQNNFNTGRWMRYNSDRFCCYYKSGSESTTGSAVTLYKKQSSSVKNPVISPVDGATFTGSQDITITQEDSKDIYYTIDGTDPTNSSTAYTGTFNVSASAITGEVTIKAIAYDGDDKSNVVEATYTDTSIQPTLISFTTNYEFLGVADKGSISSKFTKTVKGIGITIDKTSGTWARGDDTYIRIYANNSFKVDAPSGYNVKQVVFSSPGTWGAEPTVGGVAISSKTWNGDAESVQFDFSATNYISAVEITLVRALPYVVTFGDLNRTSLVKDETGTFTTTVTPATGSLVDGEDYEVTWSSDKAGLSVTAETGAFTANTRGAYVVTATATALDDATYRNAIKEYDVTVTEAVEVLADDVVMAIGDDPKSITVITTDGYAGTLSYSSGNTSIATVNSSGVVTAVAKGTTKITISSPADASNYFSAGEDVEIDVTVKYAASLSFTNTSYKAAIGGSFEAPTLSNPNSLTVSYQTSDATVADVNISTGAISLKSKEGVARITARTLGDTDYAAGEAYYDLTVYDPTIKGSEYNPFTVAEANTWIDENLASGENTGDDKYYVKGIVSSVVVDGKDYSNGTQYVYISDDGTATNQIGIYFTKYLDNGKFSITTWLNQGDEIVVCGQLENYEGDPYNNDGFLSEITRRSYATSTLPVEETFASGFGSFTFDGTKIEVSSTEYNIWNIDTSNGYAKATSYVGSSNNNAESMLISGVIDGRNAIGLELSFSQWRNKYFGTIANEAMVYAKEEGGEWVKQTISSYPTVATWGTTTLDLSAFDGKKFQIAFVYKGTSTTAGTWEVKNVKIAPTKESITVTSAGYATYVSIYPLDFTDADINAYIAETKGDGTGVKFTQVKKIPANTGILLYKAGGVTEDIPVFDGTGAADVSENVFVPGTGATVDTDGGTTWNYILNNVGGNIGFYRANGKKVAKNRAYISISKSESGVKEFITLPDFEDDADGINTVNGEGFMVNGPIYNLAGQRINKLQKGINIVNGKKVLF